MLRTADRYLDAARSMRPRQFASRPRRLVPPAVLALGHRDGDGWRGLAGGLAVDRAPQSGPEAGPEVDRTFRAFGRSRVHPGRTFWSDPADGLLFLFHLHGFAALASYAAGDRDDAGDAFWESVLEDWLTTCGRPTRVAWHPYPTSGRIMAWCAAISGGGWRPELVRRMRDSLRRQSTLLRRSVEHDIGGNHVLRNGFALVFAGVCLEEDTSETAGLRVLATELPRQLLADGGHEERSTAYHRELLHCAEDTATLLERAGRTVPAWLTLALERMRDWLGAIAGPDGDLPLLNDAWDGPRLELAGRGPMNDLAESGFVVLRSGRDQAVLDVGPMAPPHLPPHGHADALSFLLWIDGVPVVVDRGSCSYSGPDRNRFRGTAAHNTVTVAGRDQCDLWGPFRAAHMPRVRRLWTELGDDAVTLAAEHDGYGRLGVTHRRSFMWVPGAGLVVLDRLVGATREAISRVHLAPYLEVAPDRAGPLRVQPLGEGGEVILEDDRHSPYLGTSVPAQVLARTAPTQAGSAFGWALLRPGHRAAIDGDRVTVRRPDGSSIERELSGRRR
jgi:hypothetical protein